MSGTTAMATDFTGTNTEKIDKLVTTVIELRATLRLTFGVIVTVFPLLVGLISFLVLKTFDTSAKLDRLTDQISHLEKRLDDVTERLNRAERK